MPGKLPHDFYIIIGETEGRRHRRTAKSRPSDGCKQGLWVHAAIIPAGRTPRRSVGTQVGRTPKRTRWSMFFSRAPADYGVHGRGSAGVWHVAGANAFAELATPAQSRHVPMVMCAGMGAVGANRHLHRIDCKLIVTRGRNPHGEFLSRHRLDSRCMRMNPQLAVCPRFSHRL